MNEKNEIYRHTSSVKEWKRFVEAVRSKKTLEIDSDMFDRWLNVLPPAYMHQERNIDINDDGNVQSIFCAYGYAEGRDYIVDFWKKDGRFFCKQSNELKTWG